MNKIKRAFENKKAFIAFVTAGDPSLDKTEEFVLEMERAGAAMVELGVPFSDPIAEGTEIQEANLRALRAGCTTDKLFDMVNRLRKKTEIPLVFMAYANTLYKYGYERFCEKCEQVGVDGVIIPDMPFEEKGELAPIAKAHGVSVISLIVPASKERIQMIAKEADGFMYVMCSTGMTGVCDDVMTDEETIIRSIREVTDTPVIVRADIDQSVNLQEYMSISDGAMAGNAIVKIVAEHGENAGKKIYEYVAGLVSGLAE